MTMLRPDPEALRARLAELRAEREAQAPAPAPAPAAQTLTPTVNPASTPTGGGLDDGAKAELRRLPLLDIYRRWFHPAAERQGGGDEVNVSCFNTSFHRGGDANPQLGFNTAKNTYYCHACGVTGDVIDLAAVRWGFCDANWQCPDSDVHEAVRYAGEELLGMVFRSTPAGWQRVQPLVAVPVAAPVAAPPPPAPATGFTLGVFAPQPAVMTPSMATFTPPQYTGPRPEPEKEPDQDEDDDEKRIKGGDFELKWRDFVPYGSPLHNYLSAVSEDESPEEFHFWNFMSLIGLAMGKKVFLPDAKPVYGNMLLCLIGRTGQGKSRSEAYISQLMSLAMPFDKGDHLTNGVKVIKNPGSGEYLSKEFHHEIPDPTIPAQKGKNQAVLVNPSVKALVRWPEMATMIGKSSSKSSIIQTTVIDLYDVPDTIGGGSLMNKSYEARNPFGSVTTTTQLSAARKLVTEDDAASGFLNRWWFVIGKSKAFQPWSKIIDIAPLKQDVEMLVKWVEAKYRNSQGWHSMTDEAMEEASRFLVNRAHPLEQQDSEMTRRAVLSFKKLILLFSANMMEDQVSLAAVEQAEVAFEYLMDCMRHLGVRIGQTDFEVVAEAITEKITACGPEGITPRDLRKYLKSRHKVPLDVANKAFSTMEKDGMIELRVVQTGSVGRPKKRYVLTED